MGTRAFSLCPSLHPSVHWLIARMGHRGQQQRRQSFCSIVLYSLSSGPQQRMSTRTSWWCHRPITWEADLMLCLCPPCPASCQASPSLSIHHHPASSILRMCPNNWINSLLAMIPVSLQPFSYVDVRHVVHPADFQDSPERSHFEYRVAQIKIPQQ